MSRSHRKALLIHAFALTAALSLAACGGDGGDDTPAPAPTPTPAPPAPAPGTTLSGEVARNGTLKNVVVCLDLNANDACDSGEPASAPTGADGKYTLTYDATTVTGAASARLIAPVKTGDPAAASTAIDSYNPAVAATTADYVLQRPAGAGGAINPLTTLVQAGVAAGMSEADARANVALQLAIAPAKIENYQDDPAWDDAQVRDTARTAAALISGMLRQGIALQVGDQSAALDAATTLNSLSYTSANDFYVQTLDRSAKAAGTPGAQATDARSGKIGGAARPDGGAANALYRSAYLAADGWKYCDRSVAIQSTLGNPSRSVSCGVRTTLGWTRSTSVTGQAMADLVARWQGEPSNTINVGVATAGLNGALGSVQFPADSEEQVRTNVVLSDDVTIDNFWTRALPDDRRTLEDVIAKYPAAGVTLPSPAGSLSLGVSSSALRNLRVAFTGAGTVQFYECDLNAGGTVASNCATATTGTYAIETVHGERLLRFAGQPATPAVNYDVVYAQVDWGGADNQWVYRAHAIKGGFNGRLSSSNRLNQSAWAAMKAQLGL